MATQQYFSHTQHLNETGISLYVDAVLQKNTEFLPHDVREHVLACDECRSHVMEVTDMLQDTRQIIPAERPAIAPSIFSAEKYSFAYRIAAVFILAAFAGGLYFLLPRKTDQQPPTVPEQITQTETTTTVESIPEQHSTENQFAANFEPSPNLDDLVGTEFRSGSIEVVSPRIGALVSSPITFQWKQFDKPVKLQILSNKEVALLTTIVPGNSFVTSRTFIPGIYYWKLEADDALLFVGKFLIR